MPGVCDFLRGWYNTDSHGFWWGLWVSDLDLGVVVGWSCGLMYWCGLMVGWSVGWCGVVLWCGFMSQLFCWVLRICLGFEFGVV